MNPLLFGCQTLTQLKWNAFTCLSTSALHVRAYVGNVRQNDSYTSSAAVKKKYKKI